MSHENFIAIGSFVGGVVSPLIGANNLTANINNCRNCGAPHNNVKCNYCGTIYTGTQKATQVKTILLPKPKVRPKITWKTVLMVVFIPIAAIVVFYIIQHFVKRSKR